MKKSEIEKIDAALVAYTEKITRTPEAARKALVDTGIYHRDGSLTREYGGK
jgi:hypothetical protein